MRSTFFNEYAYTVLTTVRYDRMFYDIFGIWKKPRGLLELGCMISSHSLVSDIKKS